MPLEIDNGQPCTCFLGKIDLHQAVVDSLREGAAIAYLGKVTDDTDVCVTVVAGPLVRTHIQGHDWLAREFKKDPDRLMRMIGIDKWRK